MKGETKTYVRIDNWGEMELTLLVDTVRQLKDHGSWTLKDWRPRPALIDKNGKTSRIYTGQNYDPKYIDLVQDGWTHDHCEICNKTITNKDDNLTKGYNSNHDWVCEACYGLFMTTADINNELKKFDKVEK